MYRCQAEGSFRRSHRHTTRSVRPHVIVDNLGAEQSVLGLERVCRNDCAAILLTGREEPKLLRIALCYLLERFPVVR
jgi:hypothetical protein